MQIIIISTFCMPFVAFISLFFVDSLLGFYVRILFYPTLFFILGFFLDTNMLGFGYQPLPSKILIPICFLVILVADYLFRLFSGGYDKTGEAWCNIFLAITLSFTTFSLFFLMCFSTQFEAKLTDEIDSLQMLKNIGFVLLCLLITVLFHFFMMFLFSIIRKIMPKSKTYIMVDDVLRELKE